MTVALTVGATLGLFAGCALPPANWSSDLHQISTVTVLKAPPPGGVKLASATYWGSTELGAAHDPGMATLYATSVSIKDLVLYYTLKYPSYHLAMSTLDPTQQVELFGGTNPRWINIDIRIEANQPYTSPDYDLKLSRPSPPGHNTYATVLVMGQPR